MITKNKKLDIKIFTEIMDADIFTNIIEEKVKSIYSNLDDATIYPIYQQDNDPKHKSKKAKEKFKELNIPIIDWPSCSPDLNPIENIWRLLKIKVNRRRAKTVEEFKKYIIEESLLIDIKIINSLIDSMPSRLQSVIDNNGLHTKY